MLTKSIENSSMNSKVEKYTGYYIENTDAKVIAAT